MQAWWKKYLITLVIILLSGGFQAAGQGRIYTRRARLADFQTKTTKVVLSGDDILDIALREEVRRRWRISPFEFCDPEDFDALKNDSAYYFLYLSQDKAGLAYLTLLKGGNDESFRSLDGKLEVVRVPFSPVSITSGRELVYISALLDIVQTFVEESLTNTAQNILGLSFYNGGLSQARKKKIYFARDDLDSGVPGRDSVSVLAQGLMAVDNFEADSLFDAGSSEALIAFSISPAEPGRRAKCYNLIVAADTHELYYYQSRSFTQAGRRGFTRSAIKSIRREHGYKDEKRKK